MKYTKQYSTKILGLSLILASMVILLGCPAPSSTAPPITGTLTYKAIDVERGNGGTSVPVWTDRIDAKQNVIYSITPQDDITDTSVSIDTSTGIISIRDDASVSSQRYTMVAMGTDGYVGSIDAEILVTVVPAPDIAISITGTLTYPDTTVTHKDGATILPVWTGVSDAKQNVIYSITSPDDTTDTGVSIDTNTGEVTISKDAPVSSQRYTVAAMGTDGYVGSIEAQILITVASLPSITGTLTYPDTTVTHEDGATILPAWAGVGDAKQNVIYSITSPAGTTDTGVSIDTNTGEVTISKNAPVSSQRYTVAAMGTGGYVGSIEAELLITVAPLPDVTGTLTYPDTTVIHEDGATILPAWTGVSDAKQNVIYSITSPAGTTDTGISIDPNTGEVTISKDAPVSSQRYTVAAMGTDGYVASIEAELLITVASPPDITGTLTYPNTTAIYKTDTTILPVWTEVSDAKQNVIYSITSPAGTTDTGISIDPNTGEVSISKDAPMSSATYTVKAEGAEGYSGSIQTEISITVSLGDIQGELTYPELTAEYSKWITKSPQLSGSINTEQKMVYSIAPPSGNAGTGVTVDPNTGDVIIKGAAPVSSSGTYTVTATGSEGYSGSIEATIRITIEKYDGHVENKFLAHPTYYFQSVKSDELPLEKKIPLRFWRTEFNVATDLDLLPTDISFSISGVDGWIPIENFSISSTGDITVDIPEGTATGSIKVIGTIGDNDPNYVAGETTASILLTIQ